MGLFSRKTPEEKAREKAEFQARLQEQMAEAKAKTEADRALTPLNERIAEFTSKETKETYQLYRRAIIYKKGMLTTEVHPLDGVTVHLESGTELEARVTVTRILLAGPFAWAFKKKKGGERYITVEGPDFAMIMEVPRKQIKDAIKFVAKVKDAAAKAS